MKKLVALLLVFVCSLSMGGCNNTEEIDVDRVTMCHSTDGDASSEEVIITDYVIISELLAMYNSLQTKEMSRPIADERMRVVFYMGEEIVIEWYISFYEDDGALITSSNLLGGGNHVVKSEFDYEKLIGIFNATTD